MKEQSFDSRSIIFKENDPVNNIYFIKSGEVEITENIVF